MDEGIRIPVEVDTSKGLADMAKFSASAKKSISQIAPGAPSSSSGNIRVRLDVDPTQGIAGLNKFNQAAVQTNQQLSKLSGASSQATFTMTNLGRVVQDAPYGFIGIANNLNPLLESFQRLRATAGSNAGALKSLGATLSGPAGIGIAISVVSSLLVVFGDKLFGSSKAAKALEDSNKKLAEQFADQVTKLTVLVGIVKNVNSDYSDKQKAIAAINQEYAKYLPNLESEKVSLQNIDKAYSSIIDNMIRQAVVKGIQEEISKAVEETAKKIISLERAEETKRIRQQKANEETKKATTDYKKLGEQIEKFRQPVKDGAIALQSINEEQRAGIGVVNNYDAALERLKGNLERLVSPLLKLVTNFEDVDLSLTEPKVPGVDNSGLIKFAKAIQELFIVPVKLKFSEFDSNEVELAKAKGTLEQLFARKLRVKLPPIEVTEPPEFKQVFSDFKDVFAKEIEAASGSADLPALIFGDNAKLLEKFRAKFKALGSEIQIDPSTFFKGNPADNLIELNKQLDLATSKYETLMTVAQGLSSAFAEAFTGIAKGQNAIEALGNALKALIVDLIRAAIQTLILKVITNALLPGSSTISASRASLFNFKIPGLAAGGLIGGPMLTMIGEGRRTSRNNPEVAAPLDQLTGIMTNIIGDTLNGRSGGSAIQNFEPLSLNIPDEVILRANGNELVGVISLTNQSQRRGG